MKTFKRIAKEPKREEMDCGALLLPDDVNEHLRTCVPCRTREQARQDDAYRRACIYADAEEDITWRRLFYDDYDLE